VLRRAGELDELGVAADRAFAGRAAVGWPAPRRADQARGARPAEATPQDRRGGIPLVAPAVELPDRSRQRRGR
jgi:hypothetical protein